MNRKLSSALKGIAAATLSSLFGISAAHAGYTTIKSNPAEAMQMQIIAHTFGGSWHAEDGDFYDGGISAKRVDDYMVNAGVMNVATGQIGDATDQKWTAKSFTCTAVAKFSDNTQVLGTIDSHGHSESLMNVTGSGYNVSGSATCNMDGKTFEFTRDGTSGDQNSLDSMNSDDRDHMVTYEVTGLAGQTGPVWMMFWEDLNKTPDLPKGRTSQDFNDLAVEIRPTVTAVPLPSAAPAGLITLSGMLLYRGRKSLRAVIA
jgi:hypothetical protein